jgi:hypothetical protein
VGREPRRRLPSSVPRRRRARLACPARARGALPCRNAAAYAAGAANLPFGVLRGYADTDLTARTRVARITCPFAGEELAAVPAHRPNVSIIHAQQADRAGDRVTVVVTDLGILEPDPGTRELRLVRTHPGVTVEQVREATGWELRVADPLRETEPPSDGELRALRSLQADGGGVV